ncbi:MAG: hypothetical protein HOV81_38140 [Kofleriaceae bacterium]|nr:hypothetical protein [Kofleriaceae bacterium]
MRGYRVAFLIALGGRCELTAPAQVMAAKPTSTVPQIALHDIAPASLCITRGELAGTRVEVPTFRATALGEGGDAAAIRFSVVGDTARKRALASGAERRQLGLKLRAVDGCNLLYVMWRLDPKPGLEVALKRNPGSRTHGECGAHGYTKLKPIRREKLPALVNGATHELRAEIAGDAILAWVDDKLVWRGELPVAARDLSGPAGLRSDNLAFELESVSVDARGGGKVDLALDCHDEAGPD